MLCLEGRRVLVTGAAGSIGSELCRQIAELQRGSGSLWMLDHDETRLFQLRDVEGERVVGSLCNGEWVERLITQIEPDHVFHAAAYKHVPVMEGQPAQAYLNNVCALQALLAGISALGSGLTFISTDKAAEPHGIMGSSKRLGEMLCEMTTPSTIVRFGNVYGSRGSVVELFQEKIEKREPIEITDGRMTRYFMSIKEAVGLVLEATALGPGKYVLDMGEPVAIIDLASELIREAGLEPGIDIPLIYSHSRPGERLTETLVGDGERLMATAADRVLRVVDAYEIDRIGVERTLNRLQRWEFDSFEADVRKCRHRSKPARQVGRSRLDD